MHFGIFNKYELFCKAKIVIYRRRCRMFPSLVNCCTIDWFEKWPQEALLSVAKNSLKDIGDEELSQNLSIVCVAVHEVRF